MPAIIGANDLSNAYLGDVQVKSMFIGGASAWTNRVKITLAINENRYFYSLSGAVAGMSEFERNKTDVVLNVNDCIIAGRVLNGDYNSRWVCGILIEKEEGNRILGIGDTVRINLNGEAKVYGGGGGDFNSGYVTGRLVDYEGQGGTAIYAKRLRVSEFIVDMTNSSGIGTIEVYGGGGKCGNGASNNARRCEQVGGVCSQLSNLHLQAGKGESGLTYDLRLGDGYLSGGFTVLSGVHLGYSYPSDFTHGASLSDSVCSGGSCVFQTGGAKAGDGGRIGGLTTLDILSRPGNPGDRAEGGANGGNLGQEGSPGGYGIHYNQDDIAYVLIAIGTAKVSSIKDNNVIV